MACVVTLSVASLSAAAQSAPVAPAPNAAEGEPTFEIISVRPVKSGDSMQTRISVTPGGISLLGFPLKVILRDAFGVWNDRIIEVPGWVSSSRFDIEAKVATEDVPRFKRLKPTEIMAMFLPVLQDRFGLSFHHETRELTVYRLVISKGGLKMKEADPNNTYPNGFGTPDASSGAGIMRMMPDEFVGQAVPIAGLAQSLSLIIDRTVVDKTGLTGRYDFDLKWEPDEAAGLFLRGPDGEGPPPGAEPASQGTGPSIFTALQEQLGLKLTVKKEPVDLIVIDHMEQPTAN